MLRRTGVVLGLTFGAVLLGLWFFTPPDAPKPVAPALPRPAGPAEPPAAARVSLPVSGRVVRALDRSPVAGAEVLAFRAEDEPFPLCPICRRGARWCDDAESIKSVLRMVRDGSAARRPLATVRTSDDGTFLLPPLPEGIEVLARTAEGFAVQGDDPRADLELVSEPVPQLRVLDEQGRPLAGVDLILFTDLDGRHRTVTSDATGQLTLEPTDVGGWLGTDAAGYVPAALIMLGADTPSLTLSRPRALTIKTVLDGKPIDADVYLLQHSHERKLSTRGGQVRVEGLGQDPLELRAATRDLNSELTRLSLTAPATEVVLTLGSSAVLVLTVEKSPAAILSMGMVSLRAREAGQPPLLEHVRGGTTTTFGPVAVGAYELAIQVRGAAEVLRPLDLRPGRNELTVSLAGGLEVRGVVVDDLGQPLERVMVGAGPGSARAWTDAAGAFALGVEKPGPLTLEATTLAQGHSVTLNVDAPAANVRLVIAREAKLVLEVRTADRKPVRGSVMVLQDERVKHRGSFKDQLVSQPFTLAAGHYRLEAQFDGRAQQQLDFDVGVAEERRLVLDLAAGAELAGRVVSREGKGVPHAHVSALCEGDAPADGECDAQGHFAISGLVAGPCTVLVSIPLSPTLEDFEVKAPARGLVLTLDMAGRPVKGRVIDEKGQPLEGVRCEGRRLATEEGRFALFTAAESLKFEVAGYAPVTVPVTREDLGDVTLRALAACTGVVVSADGSPVPEASISMGWPDLGRAFGAGVSDKSDGSFRVELKHEKPTLVNARKQGRSGSAQCSPGAKVRIVLANDVPVEGVVFEAPGRGWTGRVLATSASAERGQEAPTDASGRFRLSLAEGLWLVTSGPGSDASLSGATSNRGVVTRTWVVKPPAMSLALGSAPGTCSLALRAAQPFSAFWLLPPSATSADEFAATPGAARVQLGQPTQAATVVGLPCGALMLTTGATLQPVLLKAPLTEVELLAAE